MKKCKKMQCAPVMQGCTPVTPAGHCCPSEYKCSEYLESFVSCLNQRKSISHKHWRIDHRVIQINDVRLLITRSVGNHKSSRPRMEDEVDAFTDAPTTTMIDTLLPDEISSPAKAKTDSSASPSDKPSDVLVSEVGGDVEPSDEPTTFSPTLNAGLTSMTDSRLLMEKKELPDEAGTTTPPPPPSLDPTLGSYPVFVPQSLLSPTTPSGHQPKSPTQSSLTHAPVAESGHSETSGGKDRPNNLIPISDTDSRDHDSAPDAHSQSTSPKTKNTIYSNDGPSFASDHSASDSAFENDLKIHPNQLYASWRNRPVNGSKKGATGEDGDRVESILDGIIHALDTRVNQELPSEPRDTIVGKSQLELIPQPSPASNREPASRREDTPDDESDERQPQHSRKDEDVTSFQLPSIPSGYVSNLNPHQSEYHVHRNQHQQQHHSYSNHHNNNKNTEPNFGSPVIESRKNSSSGSSDKAAAVFGNTVGRIQVSSKIGFSDQSNLFNIPHLPRPPTHSYSSGSFLVVGDESETKRVGSVEDESLGTHVEIITAKTPFLEANVSNSNSFLVNLSPATLKVGSSASAPSLYGLNGPVYESVEKKGSVFSETPVTPSKPLPSLPSFFAPSTNQWKIVTHNHSPKSKLPKSEETSEADVYTPVGQQLTRRSGFVLESSEEKRNEEEKYVEASALPSSSVVYESTVGSADALGHQNPLSSAESSHAITRSPPSPLLKRNGNLVVMGVMALDQSTGTAMSSPSDQRSGEYPAGRESADPSLGKHVKTSVLLSLHHCTPVSLTSSADKSLIMVMSLSLRGESCFRQTPNKRRLTCNKPFPTFFYLCLSCFRVIKCPEKDLNMNITYPILSLTPFMVETEQTFFPLHVVCCLHYRPVF